MDMDLAGSGESDIVGATPSNQDEAPAAQAGPSQSRDHPDEPQMEESPKGQHEGSGTTDESGDVEITPISEVDPSTVAGPMQPSDDLEMEDLNGQVNFVAPGMKVTGRILVWDFSRKYCQVFGVNQEVIKQICPVLGNQFGEGMLKEPNTIDIVAYSPEIIFNFLRFLHGNEYDKCLILQQPRKWLTLSTEYQNSSLKQDCETILRRGLHAGNVATILYYAILFGCDDLKLEAERFITENKEEVKEKKAFMYMEKKYKSMQFLDKFDLLS